jgi:hypothetical protein
MITVDYAKQYAERGWPVFRIRPNSKIPLDRWVNGNGILERATIEAFEIERRWRDLPKCNIGIATGHELPSGGYLTVLDLDTDEAGFTGRPDWAVETYEVATPSGGWHCYYSTETPVKSGRIAPGIDVKSSGGMVLAPPSSIDGRFYERANNNSVLRVVPVPRFLTVSDEGTSSVPYDGVRSPSQARTVLKLPADIKPGERNSQLMVNGAAIYAVAESPEAARYTIETFNQMMPEPLSPREVKNIADWLEARENWL